jgi:hypothetical protein
MEEGQMTPLAILEVGGRLLDKLIPDKTAREKAQAELLRAAQDQDFQKAMGQLEINKVEAQHSSIFVAGWRPAIGWVCVIGLAYNFLFYPILTWLVAVTGSEINPPPLLSENLMELVLGMLGLGALRSFEKWKGVNR